MVICLQIFAITDHAVVKILVTCVNVFVGQIYRARIKPCKRYKRTLFILVEIYGYLISLGNTLRFKENKNHHQSPICR